jgi:PPOX class probable F420-dependent enzyme
VASRRDQIKLSDAEQAELLDSERIVVVSSLGPRGWPHSMPMWFTVRDGELWVWTYAKSQKVRNLERDPRATLLVEAGAEYTELRGIQIEAEAEIVRDPDAVFEFGRELTIRYAEGIDSVEGDAAAALQAQAAKRVAIRFRPRRTATWDHRKLGGTYWRRPARAGGTRARIRSSNAAAKSCGYSAGGGSGPGSNSSTVTCGRFGNRT